MELLAFRIKNFRSIIDSGWQRFSGDGVTVLIGQNESGKSAVLDALALAFSGKELSENDCRVDSAEPEISVRLRVEYKEVESKLTDWGFFQKQAVSDYLSTHEGQLVLDFAWERISTAGKTVFEKLVGLDDSEFSRKLSDAHKTGTNWVNIGQTVSKLFAGNDESQSPVPTGTESSGKDANDLAVTVAATAPRALSFDVEKHALPESVDISDNGDLIGPNREAARNYLRVAKISLSDLLVAERRTQVAITEKGDKKLNERFREFFEVEDNSLPVPRLRCRLEYRPDVDSTVSRRYLSFWAADGETDFYPVQRSKGMKWFVSLFLFLSASEAMSRGRLLLLDEPGAWLHIRAQQNLLRLLNSVRGYVRIVYTTHSPQLIEYDKLYRIRAVQRMSGPQGGPTRVIDAAHLGSATSDTLSPLYAAIGADLSHQLQIQKTNNVLLEEVSAFYYLTALWQLTACEQPAYFLAATGADKLVQLSFLLRGWGLDFILAIDDDNKGRALRDKLTQTLFGGDDAETDRNLLLIDGCPGIEDVFSEADFAAHVLRRAPAAAGTKNSDYVKKLKASKPVLASQFLLAVRDKKLTWNDFDEASKTRIKSVVDSISNLLRRRATR